MEYNVFISYRRQGASEMAQLMYTRLKADGYAPFFDIESMRSGKFNTQLYDRIEECQDMLLLLPSNALDVRDVGEDWVRMEIAYALKHQKNIVPVFMRNFQWPDELPEDIADLKYCHGVTADMDYFDAVYARIKTLLHTKPLVEKVELQATDARLRVVEIMLENREFDKATEQYNQILDQDPRCASAYLGLVMAQYRLCNKEALRQYYEQNIIYDNVYFKLAREYADAETTAFLESLSSPVCAADQSVATGKCDLCGSLVCDACGTRVRGEGINPAPRVEGKLLCPDCLDRMQQHITTMRGQNMCKMIVSYGLWCAMIGLCALVALWKQWSIFPFMCFGAAIIWSLISYGKHTNQKEPIDEGSDLFITTILKICVRTLTVPVVATYYIIKGMFYAVKMLRLKKLIAEINTPSQIVSSYYSMVSITRKLGRTEPTWEEAEEN